MFAHGRHLLQAGFHEISQTGNGPADGELAQRLPILCPALPQQLRDCVLAALDCALQGRVAFAIADIHGGARIEQRACDLHVSSSGGHVKSCCARYAPIRVDVGAALHQRTHYIRARF